MPEIDDQPAADPATAILEATARLLAGRSFHDLTLADIAAEAGLPLAELHRHVESKAGILVLFHRVFDAALWQASPPDAEEGVRDRLFDAVMRRFDAMRPYREAVGRIRRDLCRDPLLLVCGMGGLLKTAALTLEVAGVSASGPIGQLKTKLMAALYLRIIAVWLDDQEADMGKTMAALDQALRRLERAATMSGIG